MSDYCSPISNIVSPKRCIAYPLPPFPDAVDSSILLI